MRIKMSSSYMRMRKNFSKIILRKRLDDPNLFNKFHSVKGRFPIHETALAYTQDYDYTANNIETDDFIKSYIRSKFDVYKLYPKTLENINDDIEKLNQSLLKCQEEEFRVPNRIAMS